MLKIAIRDVVFKAYIYFLWVKASGEGQWRMSFVLPAKYNEGPPKPIDSKVAIRKIPAKKVAVAVFSGMSSSIYFIIVHMNVTSIVLSNY